MNSDGRSDTDADSNQQVTSSGNDNHIIQAAERANVNYSPNGTIINNTFIINEAGTGKDRRMTSLEEADQHDVGGTDSQRSEENSSLETTCLSSQNSSQDVSDIEEIKTGVRFLVLGDSSEANNSVVNMLLPEDVSSQQLVQAGDVRPLSPGEGVSSQQPLQMSDVRVQKTNKITVVENSSLLKEGKLPFLEKFKKVSCICRFLFPGPNFIFLVVKGADSDEVGKEAQSQLKRVKNLLGSKVLDHIVLVLDSSTKVNNKILKNIKVSLVIHKTRGNDKEFKKTLYTSIDQLLNTSNYTRNKWYGGGPFLTVNRLLHAAVSTDLEEEVREHIRQNGYNVFTPKPDERKKKKGKRRSKTRARLTVTRGKVVKSSKKKPKRGSSSPNAHNMEQSAASIETGKLTSGKGKGGIGTLDESTKGVSHVHHVAENDCDQNTTKQPTSHGNKVESTYTSGSLSCEEVVEVGEEEVIRARRVVTEKSGRDTTADPSQSLAGTMKQEGEDHNVVQSSTWFKFDFDQKGVIATNEPPDIRRDPAIEEEQQNKPNQNIKEEDNQIHKSSKVPFDIIDLTGDEPDGKSSEKEKPCKRTYDITGKENGSPRKVQKKQDYCSPSALSIIKTMR